MIFISHNSRDKKIVEPFANSLAEVVGRDKVFYDSWSIQPGDGIIDKMEAGLNSARFFFFFVSQNSLKSNMVKLEWQNAIMQATNGKIKFIPVRLDASEMPALLSQTLYLDVYTNGFEVVLRQMIDVINGNNTYRNAVTTYQNIKVKVKRISEQEVEAEFYAETYMEPISRYGVALKNGEDDLEWRCTSDPLCLQSFNKDAVTFGGIMKANVIAISVQRATAPGFPVTISIKSKSKLLIYGYLRAINSDRCEMVPFNWVE